MRKDEKVTWALRLFLFFFFKKILLSLFSFPSIFLFQWFTFYWASFSSKSQSQKAALRRAIYRWFWFLSPCSVMSLNFYHGVATWSRGKLYSAFFTRYFRAYFRLHWADQSDLGITGKTFSSCRTWCTDAPVHNVWETARTRNIKFNNNTRRL